MLNSTLDELDQWKQVQVIFNQLCEINNLPIFVDSDEKDKLQSRFVQTIYEQNFDSIFGGWLVNLPSSIVSKNKLDNLVIFHYKPVFSNLLLSQLLISADRVFYQGDFSYIGRQILSNIITPLLQATDDSALPLVESEQLYSTHQLACFIDIAFINDCLNIKEKKLLFALISRETCHKTDTYHKTNNGHNTNSIIDNHTSDKGYLISYTRSLKDAADRSDIELKEAQILEFNLQKNLQNLAPTVKPNAVIPIENNIEVNCQLIISLTTALISQTEENQVTLAKRLFDALYKKLGDSNAAKNHSLIDLIYAGMVLLQLEFDLNIVSKLEKLMLQITHWNEIDEKNDKRSFQKQAISLFLKALFDRKIISTSPKERIIANDDKSFDKNGAASTPPFKLIFLNKNQVDLSEQLRSLNQKFDPCRFIYQL